MAYVAVPTRVDAADANAAADINQLQANLTYYYDAIRVSSGNIGFGTSTPSQKLTVAMGANTGGILVTGKADNSVDCQFDYVNGSGGIITLENEAGTQNVVIRSYDTSYFLGGNIGIGDSSPSYKLELSTDSAAKPSTNTWTVPSDVRLKEDIELADLDICYNDVKNIPLKRFKWKDDCYSIEQVRDRHIVGWIADDVKKVIPKAVEVRPFKKVPIPDGFEDIEEKDTDGNISIVQKEKFYTERIEDALALNSSQIISALYGAVQKLQIIIEEQEIRIKKLEGI